MVALLLKDAPQKRWLQNVFKKNFIRLIVFAGVGISLLIPELVSGAEVIVQKGQIQLIRDGHDRSSKLFSSDVTKATVQVGDYIAVPKGAQATIEFGHGSAQIYSGSIIIVDHLEESIAFTQIYGVTQFRILKTAEAESSRKHMVRTPYGWVNITHGKKIQIMLARDEREMKQRRGLEIGGKKILAYDFELPKIKYLRDTQVLKQLALRVEVYDGEVQFTPEKLNVVGGEEDSSKIEPMVIPAGKSLKWDRDSFPKAE